MVIPKRHPVCALVIVYEIPSTLQLGWKNGQLKKKIDCLFKIAFYKLFAFQTNLSGEIAGIQTRDCDESWAADCGRLRK